MHADELDIDAALLRRLLAAQFPRWAGLSLDRVESAGTDNAIFRLGADMAVRMPRRAAATAQVDKEFRWLPLFAPRLPLSVPDVLAVGEPGDGYPFRWCVVRWLQGGNATHTAIDDPHRAAMELGGFVRALQQIETDGGPPPGKHNFYRGQPLAARDAHIRAALPHWQGIIDVDAAAAVWQTALDAPTWDRPPVWIHGDLAPGNVLVHRGRLHAVIDFGCLGVGDPACDLMPAWNLFPAFARETFREAAVADDATWARARGWAMVSLAALPYYKDTNPAIVATATRTLKAALGTDE
jgi:aminoglycoside phosphotransferase (APT) family kinase protein